MGLVSTTGRFTREAERGVLRIRATAIKLADGGQHCKLLKDKGLGVDSESVAGWAVLAEGLRSPRPRWTPFVCGDLRCRVMRCELLHISMPMCGRRT